MKLQDKEIVSLDEDSLPILLSHPTFKVIELLKALVLSISRSDHIFLNAIRARQRSQNEIDEWIEGIKCEVLTCDGNGWQTGKVRLTLEFIPDEPEVEEISASNQISLPESPLDDLRQRINKDIQA